jgi:tetratricopeptide (TPR) repeat protein
MEDQEITPAAETTDPVESTPQIPLLWRIIAVVAALIIVAVLLYPRLQSANDDAAQNDAAQNEGVAANTAATSIDDLFRQGQLHYQNGDWDQAIAVYQQALDLDPRHQSSYVNLGDAYYQKGELDLAIDSYQQALDLQPDDADVHYNLGAAYLQQALAASNGVPDQSSMEQAITQIEQAIQLNAELPHPYYALGAAYQILGQNEQAIQNFEKFLTLDDGSDAVASSTAQQTLEQLKSAGE